MNDYGHENPTFDGDSSVYTIPGEFRRNITQFYPGKNGSGYPPPAQFQVHDVKQPEKQEPEAEKESGANERDSWGKGIEFLLSCVGEIIMTLA